MRIKSYFRVCMAIACWDGKSRERLCNHKTKFGLQRMSYTPFTASMRLFILIRRELCVKARGDHCTQWHTSQLHIESLYMAFQL